MPDWVTLNNTQQLEKIVRQSFEQACLIFKHSTRCPVSTVAANRLDSDWNKDNSVSAYYLDLIAYRQVSNLIESTFEVRHESPQVLLIKDGKCVYHTSHLSITTAELKAEIAEL